MAIRFPCPSGHELVAVDNHAGMAMCCPVCSRAVLAPEKPNIPECDQAISDTHVLKLLYDRQPSTARIWA